MYVCSWISRVVGALGFREYKLEVTEYFTLVHKLLFLRVLEKPQDVII